MDKYRKPARERVRDSFLSKLAIAWRICELKGVTDTNDGRWVAERQKILEDNLGYMGWAYMVLHDNEAVEVEFKAVCAELKL